MSGHHSALAVLERDERAVAVSVKLETPSGPSIWLKVSEVGEEGEGREGEERKEGRDVVAVFTGLSRESGPRE